MKRVLKPVAQPEREYTPHPMRLASDVVPSQKSPRMARMVALAFLGVALGAGGSVLTVSAVQAFDEFGVREFFVQEQKTKDTARRAANPAQQPIYYAPASYAPTRSINLPFFRTNDDGRLAAPQVNLNPFKKPKAKKLAAHHAKKIQHAASISSEVAVDTVSGAANMPRSLCVRVCDGFHAPLGYLASQSDLGAHEALCKAMNPGVPVKVYRVAAGATTIDEAVGPDGKTYGSLPMAFSHEKSSDPTCRPSIVKAGESRVSVLKDFTLRAGDSVVLDGIARVFNGSSQYPYRAADFRDFRQSEQLTKTERQQIDKLIGHSFLAEAKRTARRVARLKEASLKNNMTAIDMPMNLRGGYLVSNDLAYFADGQRGPVRVISPGMFSSAK